MNIEIVRLDSTDCEAMFVGKDYGVNFVTDDGKVMFTVEIIDTGQIRVRTVIAVADGKVFAEQMHILPEVSNSVLIERPFEKTGR